MDLARRRPLTSGPGSEDGRCSVPRGDPGMAVGANPSDHFQQLVVVTGQAAPMIGS